MAINFISPCSLLLSMFYPSVELASMLYLHVNGGSVFIFVDIFTLNLGLFLQYLCAASLGKACAEQISMCLVNLSVYASISDDSHAIGCV